MKDNLTIKILATVLIVFALLSFSSCCKECCAPTLEVGASDLELWTWNALSRFPQSPMQPVTGTPTIKPSWPYVPDVKVTNYSADSVRGVTVVFAWGAFGLTNWGTPIGAVAVDLPGRKSARVRGPWSFTLGGTRRICLSSRIFHPCDNNPWNNFTFINLQIIVVDVIWPFEIIPFVVDIADEEGPMDLRIDAPAGIRAQVFSDSTRAQGDAASRERSALQSIDVKEGVPQDMFLRVTNEGADFEPGNTFDVNVAAVQDDREIASFTVRFNVGER